MYMSTCPTPARGIQISLHVRDPPVSKNRDLTCNRRGASIQKLGIQTRHVATFQYCQQLGALLNIIKQRRSLFACKLFLSYSDGFSTLRSYYASPSPPLCLGNRILRSSQLFSSS